MANIKFSQFTSQVPSANTQIVGYNSSTSTNTRCTIAELSTALGLSNFVTLNTSQAITGQKQFGAFPILSSVAYTAAYGNEVKLYSSHNADSRWIFNSVGVHNKIFSFRVNDLQRWAFRVNQNAEDGVTNAGSNFELRRYNDGGAFIDSPISVSRQTGQVDFGGDIQLLASMNLGDGVVLSNAELQTLEGIGTTITIQQQLEVRPTVIAKMSIAPASVGAVTTETNLDSYEIPAGTFAVGDRFEIHMNCYFAGSAGTRSPRAKLNNAASGSVLISPNAIASSVLGYSTISFCRVIDASNIAVAVNSIGGGAGGSGSGLVSFTAANANTIYFNGQKTNSADTFVLYDWKIVKINA
jgi:hypothetical protein